MQQQLGTLTPSVRIHLQTFLPTGETQRQSDMKHTLSHTHSHSNTHTAGIHTHTHTHPLSHTHVCCTMLVRMLHTLPLIFSQVNDIIEVTQCVVDCPVSVWRVCPAGTCSWPGVRSEDTTPPLSHRRTDACVREHPHQYQTSSDQCRSTDWHTESWDLWKKSSLGMKIRIFKMY